MTALSTALTRLHVRLVSSISRDERGDVPGWVLITLMTAALVAALWSVASDRFTALFEQAMDAVSGIG